MFSKVFDTSSSPPKEGELFKELSVFGKSFKIYYGYYEDFEREGRYNEPMPIYPDLTKERISTDDGNLIVTAIQEVCDSFSGKKDADVDGCIDCQFYAHCDDLFGVCLHPNQKKK